MMSLTSPEPVCLGPLWQQCLMPQGRKVLSEEAVILASGFLRTWISPSFFFHDITDCSWWQVAKYFINTEVR